jgi:hypothetical protein
VAAAKAEAAINRLEVLEATARVAVVDEVAAEEASAASAAQVVDAEVVAAIVAEPDQLALLQAILREGRVFSRVLLMGGDRGFLFGVPGLRTGVSDLLIGI